MLALLLVAGSLGVSNFAASIAIGLPGIDAALRAGFAFAFGLFDAGMPVIGLLIAASSHTRSVRMHTSSAERC